MNTLEKFGYILKKIRIQKNISQELLAEKSGLHRTYISSLERGHRNPTLLTMKEISRALNLNLSTIILKIENNDE